MDIFRKDSIPEDPAGSGGGFIDPMSLQGLTDNLMEIEGIKGGRIGKWELMALLRSLNIDDPYLHFRFVKVNGEPSLLFDGGNIISDFTSAPVRLIFRNTFFVRIVAEIWASD